MNETIPVSVVFVDDEPLVLDGLRRQLRGLARNWEMRFAGSGEEALAMLRAAPADVVVADMRMPGMTGIELLSAIHDEWPGAARIILSGQTEQTDLLADIGVVHQFLQKPCDAAVLRRAIARTAAVTRTIQTPVLRRIVVGLRSLPVLRSSLRSLLRVIDDAGSDIPRIAEVVSRDVGITAKLLQLVNSSFFGRPRRVNMVRDAIALIGLNTLRQVAIAARTFDALAQDGPGREVIEELWLRSADLAALAADAAREDGASDEGQARARLAGSLSLVGRAVLARYRPEEFAEAVTAAREGGASLEQMEREVFGAPQQFIGGYALGVWAFEDDLIRAVVHQCAPPAGEADRPGDPLTYLHRARARLGASMLVEGVPLCTDGPQPPRSQEVAA